MIELTQEQLAKVTYAKIIHAVMELRYADHGERYDIGFPNSVTIDDNVYEFRKVRDKNI